MAKAVLRLVAGLALLLSLAGCATGSNPKDPWEPVNRKIFVFNDTLDSWVLRPVAKGYDAAAPLPVRSGVSNAIANVDDVWIGLNNILQGKPLQGLGDFGRFLINSTLGVAGLFDVASELGLDKHEEDFGQTLGVWGVGDGPYVMLPFFGPRTLRDAGGFAVDFAAGPFGYIKDIPARNIARGVRVVSERADLLSAEGAFDAAAIDRYAYLRDFYLSRRKSLVRDGKRVRDEDASIDPPLRTVMARLDGDIGIGERRLMLVALDRAYPELHAAVPAPVVALADADVGEPLEP
ncbi:VacJ family lipoprotein [Uliginosibacterium sp. H3]|uniref:VacJ family lipoprotein n=1 Tax=Uliginosibacterium silvisoli TaxID=3114758 RepID=A0ABU6K459_9RHOO|nr:VacJ family lipoprotein [Uliginosibacterium sp. H3]